MQTYLSTSRWKKIADAKCAEIDGKIQIDLEDLEQDSNKQPPAKRQPPGGSTQIHK
jgi:hypothetical protein